MKDEGKWDKGSQFELNRDNKIRFQINLIDVCVTKWRQDFVNISYTESQNNIYLYSLSNIYISLYIGIISVIK